MALPSPAEAIFAPGPWEHTSVSANGANFHLAVMGSGPLILFLHGFPTYWWTWRSQLPALAAAGYRVAAMDLRGYGGSDHTPRGYDPFSTSLDVVGVIRSLGEASATVVGHGWGGFLAWTAAALHPDAVAGIVPVAMPHPRRLRDGILHDRAQLRASDYVIGFQRPWIPERQLVADEAAAVGRYLREWSVSPNWPDPHSDAMFRAAFMQANTAHCALEYHRWSIRSIPRTDGRRFIEEVSRARISAPVLQLHGAQDRTVLPRTATGCREFTQGPFAWRLFPDVGHFVHEEASERFTSLLLAWLAEGCAWSDPPEADQLLPSA